jgi:hypothetical protein
MAGGVLPLRGFANEAHFTMADSTISSRAALRRVEEYVREGNDAMAAHREAIECCDCEAFLELGIEAFNWMVRATYELRNREIHETLELPADEFVRRLREMWLAPCEYAEQWIKIQHERGYEVSNLLAFRECCERTRRFIERDQKIQSLEKRVPSMNELASIAIAPPKEWTDEPSWSR